LSDDNVDENQPINTEIGTLTTTDPDPGGTHTYSLVNMEPCPGPDNSSFNINTDKLRTSTVFDYETKDSYTICVRSDDGNGGIYDKQFTIKVNNINEAPVNRVLDTQNTSINTMLTFSASNGTLISVSDEDAGSNPVKVTLTASNGILTLSGMSGLTFSTGDGTADANMVFTGTIASINTAMDRMSFNPTPDYTGAAKVQILTDDQGNTGSGGPLTDNDTVDIIVKPTADLSISQSSDRTGTDITYTIVVRNAGPSDVNGATVSDPVPPGISGFNWTCAAGNGAVCGAPNGTGDINQNVDLPVSGMVTFTVGSTVTTSDTVVNTATVTAPAGITDPVPDNDQAVDRSSGQPAKPDDMRIFLPMIIIGG
jgi:uncharacterized repeat protein (TIGR01451 family)